MLRMAMLTAPLLALVCLGCGGGSAGAPGDERADDSGHKADPAVPTAEATDEVPRAESEIGPAGDEELCNRAVDHLMTLSEDGLFDENPEAFRDEIMANCMAELESSPEAMRATLECSLEAEDMDAFAACDDLGPPSEASEAQRPSPGGGSHGGDDFEERAMRFFAELGELFAAHLDDCDAMAAAAKALLEENRGLVAEIDERAEEFEAIEARRLEELMAIGEKWTLAYDACSSHPGYSEAMELLEAEQ